MSRRFDNGQAYRRRVAEQAMAAFREQCASLPKDRKPELLPMTNVQAAFVQAAVKVK